jgi:hypothetical protein
MAYQWAITKLRYMYFISKRDPNSEISHNWKIHKFFIFHPFLCVFLFFELIVLRVESWQGHSTVPALLQSSLIGSHNWYRKFVRILPEALVTINSKRIFARIWSETLVEIRLKRKTCNWMKNVQILEFSTFWPLSLGIYLRIFKR